MAYAIFTITVVITLFCVWFFGDYRNNKVYDFRIYLNCKCYDVCMKYLQSLNNENTITNKMTMKYEEYCRIWDAISEISYVRMLFSTKPLKEEYWLTKEQIDFIHTYDKS